MKSTMMSRASIFGARKVKIGSFTIRRIRNAMKKVFRLFQTH